MIKLSCRDLQNEIDRIDRNPLMRNPDYETEFAAKQKK